MTKKTRRERLLAARDLLGLDDSASIAEIRKAYRNKAKEYHPDTAAPDNSDETGMHRLTEAYKTLIDYCQDFKIPLNPSESDPTDDEDWWMNRFGNDPLWGKGKAKQKRG
jgi:hypothetical protein